MVPVFYGGRLVHFGNPAQRFFIAREASRALFTLPSIP
jgi:hypothetical protein